MTFIILLWFNKVKSRFCEGKIFVFVNKFKSFMIFASTDLLRFVEFITKYRINIFEVKSLN